MYFETLTGVHPFAGIHKPKTPEVPEDSDQEPEMQLAIQPENRMFKGVSVLSNDEEIVLRPAAKERLYTLKSTEIAYFRRIFEGSTRGVFNKTLIESRVRKKKKNSKPKNPPAKEESQELVTA